MSDLSEFLLARIAEDEERGRSLVAQWSDVGNACQSCGTDGARVLGECDAKRRIVEESVPNDDLEWPGGAAGADFEQVRVMRLLALPYSDHPDYRNEWRP